MLISVGHRPKGTNVSIIVFFVNDAIVLFFEVLKAGVYLFPRVIDLLMMKDERSGVPQNQL